MSTQTNQPVTPDNSGTGQYRQPKRNNTWLYIVIIAVLFGTNIYLFINKSKMAEENKQMAMTRDSAIYDRTTLKGEYDAALARLDDLVSKNTALNNEINDKDGEISRMKKELQSIMSKKNATAAELRRAKTLIDELNEKAKGYEERIAQLEGENKTLTETNVVLAQERDSISAEATNIKKLGSVLHASNIRMSPINLKNGGKKEKETGKASRVDLLRVYFDIDENRLAENGTKALYLRITGPDGNLLSNAAYGSGITTMSDGSSLNYTLEKDINLVRNQPVKDVSVDWHQESEYRKGNYNIEIYNEGYKIGSGSVTLR